MKTYGDLITTLSYQYDNHIKEIHELNSNIRIFSYCKDHEIVFGICNYIDHVLFPGVSLQSLKMIKFIRHYVGNDEKAYLCPVIFDLFEIDESGNDNPEYKTEVLKLLQIRLNRLQELYNVWKDIPINN